MVVPRIRKPNIQATQIKPKGELEMEVKAKRSSDGEEYVCQYEFGENLAASVARFGETVVHAGFVADAKTSVQGQIRRLAAAGKPLKEIQEFLNTYKPGIKALPVKADPMVQVLAKFGTMSIAEQEAYIEELRAQARKQALGE
jgi:basic membrane lipoprotein Med (substrate-binding protein (PBP1-ABC) superfamily)